MHSTDSHDAGLPGARPDRTTDRGRHRDFRGAIQGAQARRLMARVQQRGWQRLPSPSKTTPRTTNPQPETTPGGAGRRRLPAGP